MLIGLTNFSLLNMALWLLVLLCSAGEAVAQASSSETGRQSAQPSPFVFDADRACGANSLFLLNVMLGGSHAYSDCLALVPPRDTGNTMLELHRAMESMGWAVSALNASPARRPPELPSVATISSVIFITSKSRVDELER